MSARFFLDTNIFVYTFDSTAAAKSRRAQELIREGIESRRGIVSFQVVQEFFSIALRRFAVPMATSDAEQYLSTVFRPLCAVQSSQALYAEAIRLSNRFGLSWYDSVIVAAALEAECGVLYSEDFQSGQTFGLLKVVNPFNSTRTAS
jgi:predicted nucleic acid-binding protein